ncbi:MAG: 50S ribosomal protein L6 [Candidatus Lightella neohaematopini]|nr:50S ribosomal protein L6 [Candidatus Lightella neohaematopini]MCV2524645.1 50S ribosomal protein L6 [Candidatus Lightella neohaematopini]
MSRIAKKLIIIPNGIHVLLNNNTIIISGNNITNSYLFSNKILIKMNKNELLVSPLTNDKKSWAIAGTTRSIINNIIIGITTGFSKTLQLIGIGYRAQINYKENILTLFLGFSHAINYKFPKSIMIKCVNNTDIIITGYDKQLVGQIAANIRSYRTVEPYKGKGIRYLNEIIKIKEIKKNK